MLFRAYAILAYSTAVMNDVLDAIEVVRALCKRSLSYFLDVITIPSTPYPKRFGECIDPWQRDMLAPMIPAVDSLAGLCEHNGPWRFMHILARGHNKSSLEAWIAAFLLYASKRIIHGYVLAADRDQGRLILQAVDDLLRLNPWIDLTVQRNRIVGPGGTVDVLSCDAASSMGLRGNFYIADEFTHWRRQDEWTAIVTGLRKVHPTLFAAISNAGVIGSWQHQAYVEACENPEWSVFHRRGILASWLDHAGIERDRRLIPPSEAKRLYDNEWVDPSEDYDYIRRSEVALCERDDLHYRLRREPNVDNYVAAIDYGPRKDRTALCVGHCDANNCVIVDRLDVWCGRDYPDGIVPIVRVERWIDEIVRSFNPRVIIIDPYQMEGTLQWAKSLGYPVEPFRSRGGAGNYEMAQHLRALILTQRLFWPRNIGLVDGETLADEIVALRVKPTSYGYRFDHENNKHDDRAVAVSMMALAAVTLPSSQVQLPSAGRFLRSSLDGLYLPRLT